mmetsp:Transcript_1560/g.4936  ORF Transcript_1560/g.4936 Transcript_1560/m.4936 type:complete len:205 (+) Transcript_1560:918-1532(+)
MCVGQNVRMGSSPPAALVEDGVTADRPIAREVSGELARPASYTVMLSSAVDGICDPVAMLSPLVVAHARVGGTRQARSDGARNLGTPEQRRTARSRVTSRGRWAREVWSGMPRRVRARRGKEARGRRRIVRGANDPVCSMLLAGAFSREVRRCGVRHGWRPSPCANGFAKSDQCGGGRGLRRRSPHEEGECTLRCVHAQRADRN